MRRANLIWIVPLAIALFSCPGDDESSPPTDLTISDAPSDQSTLPDLFTPPRTCLRTCGRPTAEAPTCPAPAS